MSASRLAATALLLAATPASAALSYQRFVHPRRDYAIEYPSDWKRSVGIETLKLRPPGRAGQSLRLSIEKRPLGSREPATPAAFIDDLLKRARHVRRLESRDTVKVSGRDAERLVLTETAPLRDGLGTPLRGPVTEVIVVVPFGKSFYALRLIGAGSDLPVARREFDRLVAGLTLGPAPAP